MVKGIVESLRVQGVLRVGLSSNLFPEVYSVVRLNREIEVA